MDPAASSVIESGAVLDAFTKSSTTNIDRLAELIAAGQAQLPTDLSPDDLRRLFKRVRQRRRENLIHYLARCIAKDILQSAIGYGDRPDA